MSSSWLKDEVAAVPTCRKVGRLKPVDRAVEFRCERLRRTQEARSSRASHSVPGPEEGAPSERAGESEGEVGSNACNLLQAPLMEG